MKHVLPPGWLFYHQIINWIADKKYNSQLPPLYKILGIYCACYFWLLPNAGHLKGGRQLFALITRIYIFFGRAMIVKFEAGGYSLYIDLSDARFIQVVNELRLNAQTNLINSIISEGEIFIDVGANQGGFSIVASHRIGPSGKIYAFEPIQRLAKNLDRSLAEAPAQYQVYQIALGDQNTDVEYIIPLSYSGIAGLFVEFSGRDGYQKTNVKMHRCDDILAWRSFSERILIKLDIEGGEYKFLLGASELIKQLQPNILMEINPLAMSSAGTNSKELVSLLKSLGYKRFSVESNINDFRDIENIAFDKQHNIFIQGR